MFRNIITPSPDDVALVTGGNSGIGRGAADEFTREGIPVITLSSSNRSEGPLSIPELLEGHLVCDLAAPDAHDAVVEGVRAKLGRNAKLRFLVHSAGIGFCGEPALEQRKKMTAVNATAPANITRALRRAGMLAKNARHAYVGTAGRRTQGSKDPRQQLRGFEHYVWTKNKAVENFEALDLPSQGDTLTIADYAMVETELVRDMFNAWAPGESGTDTPETPDGLVYPPPLAMFAAEHGNALNEGRKLTRTMLRRFPSPPREFISPKIARVYLGVLRGRIGLAIQNALQPHMIQRYAPQVCKRYGVDQTRWNLIVGWHMYHRTLGDNFPYASLLRGWHGETPEQTAPGVQLPDALTGEAE